MKRLKQAALGVAALMTLAILVGFLTLRGSLPQLDGKIVASQLASPVSIERDVLGVPTITAANRIDLAYATGYVHSQDRLFQMDLQRRLAAGELAELLGKDFIQYDKRFRRHNFRKTAGEVLAQATDEQRKILGAYVDGVNAAREAMSVRPFEYLLLRTRPAPWTLEDCVLVAFSMYIELNDSEGAHELERGRLHAALPQQVFDILYPRGSEWDVPLDGVDVANARPPLPGADVLDLRQQRTADKTQPSIAENADYPVSSDLGSNNWAVSARRTANGGALVANDMHLSLRLPNIWYRARLIVKSNEQNVNERRVERDLSGVTLPGLPFFVAGSNGRIAWGYTNTHGDYDDLVVIDTDAQHPHQYRVGARFVDYEVRRERINVRGGKPVDVEYRHAIWGPIIDDELDGKPLAVAWTAHHADATNFRQLELETATSVTQAIEIANTVGMPVQNFIVADRDGQIGWTLIGKLPKRVVYDSRLPQCWGCAADIGWRGWLESESYPRVINAASGQLWSANSRTLGGAGAELIGDDDMDRGARAKQIRDDLLALDNVTPQEMLEVQLDDRAIFLKRWRDALISLLDDAYIRGYAWRSVARDLAVGWSGHARVDDAGYRVIRAFRAQVQADIYRSLIAPATKRYPGAEFNPSARFEDSLWQIVTTQPMHLLNSEYESWNAQLLASLDRALSKLREECGGTLEELKKCTWGKRNTLEMEHPLAPSLSLIGVALRVSRTQLPGDSDMPRVQGKSFGASERFAVSPGREAEGYFHMPGGQSGHPLSPFFTAGHEAWVKGEPTSFLPGATRYRLLLTPATR